MQLPDFPWDRLAGAKARAASVPGGIVDLSVGTPIDPTPQIIQQALCAAADSPGYPTVHGTPAVRQAAADWMQRALGVTVAPDDILPLIGTKEFVALLPETDIDEAEAAAERIRVLFARSEITPVANTQVTCTASIGVTTFVPGETPRDFVARADSGTYEAKRQGKNRVIRIPPPTAA